MSKAGRLRMMWDSSLNADDLVNEYYDNVYGKEAGKKICEYHDLLESSIKDFVKKNNKKLFDMDELGVSKIDRVTKLEAFYPKVRAQARTILNDALAKAPAGKCKKMVQFESDNFKAVELTLDAMQAYEKVKNNASMENVVAFKNAVDAREAFLNANKGSMAVSLGSIRRSDNDYHLPVTKKMADYFLSTKGKRMELECPMVSQPPVIDGKLNDACWKNAVKIGNFLKKDDAAKVNFNSTVMLARDKDNFYIALECDDPEASNLLEAVSRRDGAIWEDNEIELFFDLKRNGKEVYHFLFNSAGFQADLKHLAGKSDIKWDGEWVVKTSKDKDKWFAEVKIPYSTLSKTPLKGDIWRINICRVRKTKAGGKGEYSQVTPTFGNFMNPDKFANLIIR